MNFFTKNPNLKQKKSCFFCGGGGGGGIGGGGMRLEIVIFLIRIQIKTEQKEKKNCCFYFFGSVCVKEGRGGAGWVGG